MVRGEGEAEGWAMVVGEGGWGLWVLVRKFAYVPYLGKVPWPSSDRLDRVLP